MEFKNEEYKKQAYKEIAETLQGEYIKVVEEIEKDNAEFWKYSTLCEDENITDVNKKQYLQLRCLYEADLEALQSKKVLLNKMINTYTK